MIFQCFPLQCSPFSNSGILRSVSRTPYHLLPATLGLRAKVSTLGGASCSQQESSSASIPQKALQTLKCLKTLSRKSINWPKKQACTVFTVSTVSTVSIPYRDLPEQIQSR